MNIARTAYPRKEPEFILRFLAGSVLLIFLDFCVVLLCVFTFCVMCSMSTTISAYKRCSVGLYLQLFVGGIMS